MKKKIFLVFILIIALIAGAILQKKEVFPFGYDFIQTLRVIKKNQFNLIQSLNEELERINEFTRIRNAIESSKEKTNIYRSTAHLLNVEQVKPKFRADHFAILEEINQSEIEVISILGNHSSLAVTQPLVISKIIIDLDNAKLITNEKLLEIKGNLRATDVLITNDKRIFISYVQLLENEEFALKVIELINKGSNFSINEIFQSSSVIADGTADPGGSGGKMIQFNENEILIAVGHMGQWGFEDIGFPNIDKDFGKAFLVNINDSSRKKYAIGLRNIQGLFKSGEYIIETEHGPEGGDEINLIELNEDYGWPYVTYGAKYREELPEAKHDTKFGSHDGFTKPLYTFIPSIGIKAIEQLPQSQTEFPNWKNNFLICSKNGIYRTEIYLQDNQSRVIFSSRLEDKVTGSNPAKTVSGCRDIQVNSLGKIITNDGTVITKKVLKIQNINQ
jgi:hypothetical protein